MPYSVNIIYNKTNTFGLADDVQVIERILKKLQDSVGQQISKARLLDMREPPVHCDIQFHLEIPIFSAIPWGHTNVLLVNPEQWSLAYDSYVHAYDALIFRDSYSAEQFRSALSNKGIACDNIYVVPWCDTWSVSDFQNTHAAAKNEFVCFLAGSSSKYQYVKQVVPFWLPDDPPLTIYTTREDFAEGLKALNLPGNIHVRCEDLTVADQKRLLSQYNGHLVCSQGEAFGYAAAHSETVGGFCIMNALPCFEYGYDVLNRKGVEWLSNVYELSSKVRYALANVDASCSKELEEAIKAFRTADFSVIREIRQSQAKGRFLESCGAFLPVLRMLDTLIKERRPNKGVFDCPPILNPEDCPPITIITPTYNREKLLDIAFHNLLSTDYPQDKIEWIVVEDNEIGGRLASQKIVSFQIQVPALKLKYIPIEGRMTIGEKRNHGIEHASNDIILFMDDDDHYPTTSFRRRVAWLTKGTKRGSTGKATIACCTTLALYDLRFGISAVNVPPFEIPFAQRVSEATLTFRKSAWLERRFPHVSIAEGEDWITGRENQVIEIPPQQIIVAFTHGSNQSSRRIPPVEQKPACFWGFPKEYLVFIHGLVGITVEEDKKR